MGGPLRAGWDYFIFYFSVLILVAAIIVSIVVSDGNNEQQAEPIERIKESVQNSNETICRNFGGNPRPCIQQFIIDGIELDCFILGSGRDRAMSCNWNQYRNNINIKNRGN